MSEHGESRVDLIRLTCAEQTDQRSATNGKQGRMTQTQAESGLTDDLRNVARVFTELGARIKAVGPGSALDAIVTVAVESVDGVRWASITRCRADEFSTVASSADEPVRADAIQYDLGSGPCVDAIITDTVYRPRDLRTDDRWPEYGRRVAEEVGALSMLSYRMGDAVDGETVHGLNLYADHTDAFDERAEFFGLLLATHGAAAVSAVTNRDRAQHLERALLTNRDIGVALGVLMSSHKITRDEAFGLLRVASQNSNRKLRDVAVEVAETGVLEPLSMDASSRHTD